MVLYKCLCSISHRPLTPRILVHKLQNVTHRRDGLKPFLKYAFLGWEGEDVPVELLLIYLLFFIIYYGLRTYI